MNKSLLIFVASILTAIVIIITFTILNNKQNNHQSFNNLKNFKKLTELQVIPIDFKNNGFIPTKFTCDWENIFPKIEIKNIPTNTKTLAIIVEDPDAPMSRPFIHLVAANIPVNWDKLIIDENLLKKWILGKNDFWQIWWWWPCPPHWHWIHHYHFKFFAIDSSLPLNKGFDIKQLKITLENYENHIIGYWEIVWLYKR